MSDNIKITMLGTIEAGKTCFMVGMYAVMQLGVHGFTLSAQDLDEDIELTDKWEQLCDGGDDRFPTGTSQTHKYIFNFNYGFRKLMSFEWMDYRGGALRDKTDKADVQELDKSLRESSCVFLCISGDHLSNKIENQADALKLAKKTRVDRMNQFLSKLYEENGPVPVVVAITKYDLCMHRKSEEIREDIKQLFSGLFAPDGKWLVTICPVSLGKGLSGDKFHADIDPVNLHLPLVFAIYSKLIQYAAYVKEQESIFGKQLTDMKNQNFVLRWWNSDEIAKANEGLRKNQALANEVQDKLSLLAKELGRAKIYFNGEEQEINV
jgi:hypothetical protein